MESESLFGANLCMPRTLCFDLAVPTFLFASFKWGGGGGMLKSREHLERKRFLKEWPKQRQNTLPQPHTLS